MASTSKLDDGAPEGGLLGALNGIILVAAELRAGRDSSCVAAGGEGPSTAAAGVCPLGGDSAAGTAADAGQAADGLGEQYEEEEDDDDLPPLFQNNNRRVVPHEVVSSDSDEG
jgi:hypothetical protein